ncbi:MAG: nucleoside deaminase [Burkholderiales bacterium]|jgi:tRNA(Arg) A34 adenosine deaminase TadA|nr:nucleoside deaminase [Burkholderiales bacterium]
MMTKTTEDDRRLLQRAVELAAENAREEIENPEGGPFGAVIARGSEIIAEGKNRELMSHDPSAHAEIEAIRAACRKTRQWHLPDVTLYASSEPCPMCLAAAYWARIERIVYANSRAEAKAIGFGDAEIYQELSLPEGQRRLVMIHLSLPDASHPLVAWKRLGRAMY